MAYILYGAYYIMACMGTHYMNEITFMRQGTLHA